MIVPLPGGKLSSILRGRDRAMIVAVILVNVIVVLGVVLLARSDDGDEADATRPVPPPPRAGRAVENRAIGARIRKPRGWVHRRVGNALNLRSPDSTTIVSISLPPGATNNTDVLRSAQSEIRRQYRRVKVARQPGRVAGLPTVSVVISAVNRKGTPLNIFVSAAQGRNRAWLVQIFSAPGARSKRLPEAQVSIGTLRLSG